MNKRPLSVAIVGWFLIVTSTMTIWTLYRIISNPLERRLMEQIPLPVGVQIAVIAMGIVVGIVCGWAILKGQNWGRTIYVGWSLLGMIFALVTPPFTWLLLIPLTVLAITAFFLFRAPANAFFGHRYFGSGAA